jgi:MarR family transcriptional regulator, organic hydroperoxide resistance regulator
MHSTETRSGPEAIAARIARFVQTLKRPDGPWSDLPLTLAQLRVLAILGAHPAGLSGRELAAQLKVGPSAITPLVDRLVDHGFARREEDLLDRRVTRSFATARGLELLERIQAGHHERLVELARRLSPDERDLVERALTVLEQAAQRPEAVA